MASGGVGSEAQGLALSAVLRLAVVAALALGYGGQTATATAESQLAEAINSTATAKKSPVLVTITEDIVLSKALPLILGPVHIKGACPGRKCVVDGGGKFGIFQAYALPPRCAVTIENLSLINAKKGAVYSTCDLRVINVHFKRNNGQSALSLGLGAAFWHVEDCLFETNSASGSGGGIFVSSFGQGRIVRTTFKSNKAGEDGGAVRIFTHGNSAGYVFDRVIFDSNTAGKRGGAVFVSGTIDAPVKVLVSRSRFLNNVAAGGAGGALALTVGTDARICDTSVAGGGNRAKGDQGNDVALLNGNYHPLMLVYFCPAKPDNLSLYVTPALNPPIVRYNSQVCTLRNVQRQYYYSTSL
ncbi:hypothetical protein CBR_g40346 [Chara braunii]|uniref:Right handed beta helix domain-containing protein n=1 Tax=Chara braunii TaxID=69332 RepID=A0A388LTF7_CHABU|nr:hypothetical protein CBR_g40346 [Chara braunii]|eukprot:GBG85618.1 hypothetical protein CBR_g40346 [Chara braunii]